jgi:hypothetical protein
MWWGWGHAPCHGDGLFRLSPGLPEVTSPPRIEPFQPCRSRSCPTSPPRAGALLADAADLCRLCLCGLTAFVLYRTPLGLAVRAAGENPAAVEAQGLSVTGLRMGAVIVGSGLMAVGGAFLTLSAFSSFFFEMVNGRGWICIALVVFGAWRPGKAVLGALLFAAFDALQIRAAADAARRGRALSGVPDGALRAVDPRADPDVAPGRGACGADGALQQGGTLTCST